MNDTTEYNRLRSDLIIRSIVSIVLIALFWGTVLTCFIHDRSYPETDSRIGGVVTMVFPLMSMGIGYMVGALIAWRDLRKRSLDFKRSRHAWLYPLLWTPALVSCVVLIRCIYLEI